MNSKDTLIWVKTKSHLIPSIFANLIDYSYTINNNILYIHGGYDTSTSSLTSVLRSINLNTKEVYNYDSNKSKDNYRLSNLGLPAITTKRKLHAISFVSYLPLSNREDANGYILIHGGVDAMQDTLSSIIVYDLYRYIWINIMEWLGGVALPTMHSHSISIAEISTIYNTISYKVILAGTIQTSIPVKRSRDNTKQYDRNTLLNSKIYNVFAIYTVDLELNGIIKKLTTDSNSISARYKHSITYIPSNNNSLHGDLFVVGGKSTLNSKWLKDIWRYNIQQNIWQDIRIDVPITSSIHNRSLIAYYDKFNNTFIIIYNTFILNIDLRSNNISFTHIINHYNDRIVYCNYEKSSDTTVITGHDIWFNKYILHL